jgi:hypothetical protein
MLITMLVYYSAIGRPHYPSMDPDMTIPHISDVGAFTLKPLFITGSVITTVFLDLAFLSERWLRHNGRLARNTTRLEKILSNVSIAFAVIGTVGLVCLSIFDSYRYGNLHNIFLAMFIGGYIISAIFLCWAYQRLGIRELSPQSARFVWQAANGRQTGYREHRILRISFWVKLVFIIIEDCCAIGKSFRLILESGGLNG